MRTDYTRYSIDWVPTPGTGIADFGKLWTGWCADHGELWTPPDALANLRTRARVGEPFRRRGLHAPLFGPFEMADGVSHWSLVRALEDFAEGQSAVRCARLRVRISGDRVVLLPDGHSPKLDQAMAHLRETLSPLTRRAGVPSVGGLSLPLSGILDPRGADDVLTSLTTLLEPVLSARPKMTNIVLSGDPGDGRPWRVLDRFAFSAPLPIAARLSDALHCVGPLLLTAQLFGEAGRWPRMDTEAAG